MIRWYLIPMELVTVNGRDYRGPKYLEWRQNPDGIHVTRSNITFYGRALYGVIVIDAPVEIHAQISAFPDVYTFPENLDVIMGQAERQAFAQYFEGIGVPADWITPQDTFRTALKTVVGMFLFLERLIGYIRQDPFAAGIGLNDQFQALPVEWQNAITASASAGGYDISWLKPNQTVRVLLKSLSDTWQSRTIEFGFVTI